jgi:flagellar biosynthesis/type III secretory pathway chaperone
MTTANGAASDWNELIHVLNEQAAVYKEFLNFLTEKEKALVKGDMKKLNNLLKKEKTFVGRLDKLEDKRRASAAGCAAAPDGEAPTLRELLEVAPDAVKNRLDETAVKMIETLNEVAIKNKSNAELVGAAMEFVNYMLNLMSSSAAPGENTYESSGRVRQPDAKVKSILNKQV